MAYRLIAKAGSKNKLTPNYEKQEIFCELSVTTVTPPELYTLLFSSLGKYDELIIDYLSFANLFFEKIYPDSLALVLYTIFTHHTNTPFSLKTKEEPKKWTFEGSVPEHIETLVYAQNFAKKLQEYPPNLLVPETFVDHAKELLKDIDNVKLTHIDYEGLKAKGLRLIEAVGKASINKPCLLIIEYTPKAGEKAKALVGKGISFDTGGINVKTGSYMSNMKFDMSGAASSLATIYALAKNKSSDNLIVLLPLAENAIAENAYKPDDVVVAYSGKSVEIDNTDAEGRLVLADALAYAAMEYAPTELITIATLTGAIGYALGYKYGGAWATTDKAWNELYEASLFGGEWIWRMPFDDYYLQALKKTRVADIKNSARTGAGGASRAACFLKEFTSAIPYIHLDIANIAHGEGDAVGYAPMIRTLYYYLFKN